VSVFVLHHAVFMGMALEHSLKLGIVISTSLFLFLSVGYLWSFGLQFELRVDFSTSVRNVIRILM
jgi:hypothetical protein